MTKSFLVTGGSGFIGASLVQRLVLDGHKVRVLDNNTRGNCRRLRLVEDDIDFIYGDIRDSNITKEAAKGMDCVCHLAYVNGTEFFYTRPELVLDVAIRGMINVIDACRQHNIGDLIIASSSEVYQSPSQFPTPEEVPLVIPDISNPRYSYGGGKILCELIGMNYGRTDFDRVVIFRPHNVYGPDMGWEHVIPQFAIRAKELCMNKGSSITFPIKGNGKQTRSFIYIEDFIEGLIAVIEKGKHLSCYNIGTDFEVSIAEVARQVVACFGLEAIILPSDPPSGETNRRCPDLRKICSLGYNPVHAFSDGLRTTVNWYSENYLLRPSGHPF